MEIDRKELKRRARADMGAAQPPFWAVLLAYLKAVDVRRPPEKEISPPPKSEKTPERQEGFFDGIPGVPVDEIFGKEERS